MSWRRFNRDFSSKNLQRYRNGVGIFDSSGNSVTVDPDAQDIIDFYISLGYTPSSIDQVTISNWVAGRKSVGQYGVGWSGAGSATKIMRGFWEFLGGTASYHRVNWADPMDLDAAYRLQYFGGFTHSSPGSIQGDSITNYVRCYVVDSGLSSVVDRQFGAYPRTDSNPSAQVDMGRGTSQIARLQCRSGGSLRVEHYSPQQTAVVSDSLGPHTVYRDATRVYTIKGTTVVIDAAASLGGAVASEYLLTATNNTDSAVITPAFRSGREYTSFWVLEGFSASDIIDFHNSVVQLEIDLGK